MADIGMNRRLSIKSGLKIFILALLGVYLIFPVGISAQYKLEKYNSKEMGFRPLDYTATEISRTERKSILRIPGFHARSAAASRWMMCVYTELAKKRKFQFWAVVYPDPPSEDVLVGFPASLDENIVETLGPEFGGEKAPTTMPVEKMTWVCREMLKRQ